MTDFNSQSVLERLAGLERENQALRRLWRTTVFSALGIVAVAVGGAATFQNVGKFQQSVEVYDAQNVMRAVLYASDAANKSGLELRDTQGRKKLGVHTYQNDDPYVHMFDDNGKLRVDLGISPTGDAYLSLYRGNGVLHQSFIAPMN